MKFNVRVYGIFVDEEKGILVSDEYIQKNFYSKFCGGGLEFGEGPIDCLIREFKEEMDLDIKVTRHLYTTDFFIESKFAPDQQVISIYYEVEPASIPDYPVQANNYSSDDFFLGNEHGVERFRYIPLASFTEDSVSLPIDKIVAKIILQQYQSKK